MRSRDTKVVVFNGEEYRRPPSSNYYRRAGGGKHVALHRAVWIHHHGPIPPGYDIHHRDGDTDNNDVSNLECLTDAEHARRHIKCLPPELRRCGVCGAGFACSRVRGGGYSDPRKRFCSIRCANAARRPRQCQCVQCGRAFESAGFGRYGSVVRFCSAACGNRYRYLHNNWPSRSGVRPGG